MLLFLNTPSLFFLDDSPQVGDQNSAIAYFISHPLRMGRPGNSTGPWLRPDFKLMKPALIHCDLPLQPIQL